MSGKTGNRIDLYIYVNKYCKKQFSEHDIDEEDFKVKISDLEKENYVLKSKVCLYL
jgi:hypothetical protein